MDDGKLLAAEAPPEAQRTGDVIPTRVPVERAHRHTRAGQLTGQRTIAAQKPSIDTVTLRIDALRKRLHHPADARTMLMRSCQDVQHARDRHHRSPARQSRCRRSEAGANPQARAPFLYWIAAEPCAARNGECGDRKSTRLNSSHSQISYA